MPFDLSGEGKKAEGELDVLRFMINHSPVGKILVDKEHKIVAATDATARIFGYETAWAFRTSRTTIEDLLPDDEREAHELLVDRFFQNPRPITLRRRGEAGDQEKGLLGLHRDGSLVRVGVMVQPFVTDKCRGFCLDNEIGKCLAFGTIVPPELCS